MNQLEIAIDNKLCLKHGGKSCELNFEDNRFVTVKIRATDNGSPARSADVRFTISLLDVNEAPRSLQLSKSVMMENATIGSIVGRFTFDDEDFGQIHNISLLSDDNGRFGVDQQFNLVKAKPTNYEVQTQHIIRVLVKDNGNPSLSVGLLVQFVNVQQFTLSTRLNFIFIPCGLDKMLDRT